MYLQIYKITNLIALACIGVAHQVRLGTISHLITLNYTLLFSVIECAGPLNFNFLLQIRMKYTNIFNLSGLCKKWKFSGPAHSITLNNKV